MSQTVSLCQTCFPACYLTPNHCAESDYPTALYYTISASDPTFCLNGFSDYLYWDATEAAWFSTPQDGDYGTMTCCKCNSAPYPCCSNMGISASLGCETGPPFFSFGMEFGGCISDICTLAFSSHGGELNSCSPFMVTANWLYNPIYGSCISGNYCTLTITIME
jgi:hypothetical protein